MQQQYPKFFREHRKQAAYLEGQLKHLAEIRPVAEVADDAFLDWYETTFLREVAPARIQP